jgi:hypothetical protein
MEKSRKKLIPFPDAMTKILSVQALPDMEIRVVFTDGLESNIDLSDVFSTDLSRQLRDPACFRTVHVDSGGGLEWDNGFDICPTVVREKALHTA